MNQADIDPRPWAHGVAGTRHVFIRDLVLPAAIGVHGHERGRTQRVRINLDLSVHEGAAEIGDRLENVVSYETVVDGIRTIVGAGHVNLVETLAEQIADMCLADPRIAGCRVRVEKLDVLPEGGSVGVEIERLGARRGAERRALSRG